MATWTLTSAQTNNPTGTGTSGVQGIINGSASGDTIVLYPGSYTWGSGNTNTTPLVSCGKSITFIGTGVTITSQYQYGYLISLVSGTDGHIWLEGLEIIQGIANNGSPYTYALAVDRSEWNNSTLSITSPGNQYTVICKNCTFNSDTINNYMVHALANGVLFGSCTFLTSVGANSLCGINFEPFKYTVSNLTSVWAELSTMGLSQDNILGPSSEHLNVGDTASGYMGVAGLNCCYVEDCTCSGGSEGSFNASGASRIVFRYNTCADTQCITHGQDTDSIGNRHYEVYENTFNTTDPTSNPNNVNCYFSSRGGIGVIFNNTMNTLPAGKSNIIFACQQVNRVPTGSGIVCPTGYPAPRQVGIGWSPNSTTGYGNPVSSPDGEGQVKDPFYVWGNTGAGSSNSLTSVDQGLAGTGLDACGNGYTGFTNFTGNVTSGSNTISSISIQPQQTGSNPQLFIGMGIYDPTNNYFPQGTTITGITGSVTAPTSITVSANSLSSGTGITINSGMLTQGWDFYLGSSRSGYIPYTYPHPLLSGTAPATPVVTLSVN